MKRCLLILALLVPLFSRGESFRAAEERLNKEIADNRSFRAELQKRQRQIGKATDARSLAELGDIRQLLPSLVTAEKKQRCKLAELRAGLDTTTGKSDICPAHKKPMRVIRGPIGYGLQVVGWNEPPPLVRQRQFPFALDYWDGGCGVMPYAKAWFYLCPDCQRAEKQWRKVHKNDGPDSRQRSLSALRE